jgi:hypothetical protein
MRGDRERVRARADVDVPAESHRTVEIDVPEELEPVTVEVRDPRGVPMRMAEVTVLSMDPARPLRAVQWTDTRGEVTLRGLRGLPVEIAVRREGFAPLRVRLDALDRPPPLVLEEGAAVEGRVRDGRTGAAIAGASGELRAGDVRRWVRTDSAGHFFARDLPAGPLTWTFSASGFAPVSGTALAQASSFGRPVSVGPIELREGCAVEGVVRDGQGRPVGGARVAEGSVPRWLPEGSLPANVVLTDKGGVFALRDIPCGEIVVEARAPGMGQGQEELTVSSDRPRRGVSIILTSQGEDEREPEGYGVAVTLAERDGAIVVFNVVSRSEADEAGMLAGDVLLAVDGTVPTTLESARSLLTSTTQKDLLVRLAREGQERVVRVSLQRLRR